MKISIILLTLFVLVVTGGSAVLAKPSLVVNGVISDEATGEPIAYATVRVENTGRSTLTNEIGEYRLILPPGEHQIKFSHIAYYSQILSISGGEGEEQLDVRLKSSLINVAEIKVSGRALDPGQRIILEAIKRKKDILSRIHDYEFDAYVKLVVDDLTSDSSDIYLLTESEVTAYWEQPDKYKEVITARRQTANIEAEQNLVTVGGILDFNRNRIEVGRYSIVSPTAKDALDYYNYYLLDTLFVDNKAVFRIEIEPKNPENPLFEGIIHIADSTFDVVQVDVGFSPGAEFSLFHNGRYTQKFAQYEGEYRMPVEIRFSGVIEFNFPFPGIPNKLGITHVASIHSYAFETGSPDNNFDEFAIEVEPEADEVDTVAWKQIQSIPHTAEEDYAYARIDSIEAIPPTFGNRLAQLGQGTIYLLAFGADDLFHFNRVEGAYVGVGLNLNRQIPNTKIRLKTGYGFDSKHMQHGYGLTYRLEKTHRVDLSLNYFDEVTRRPTIMSSMDESSTLGCLMDGTDPFDYHREQGFGAGLNGKLINHVELSLGYHDLLYYSLNKETNYTWFGPGGLRDNLTSTDGKLRSWDAELSYDSRKMIKVKGKAERIDAVEYTLFTLGYERASPDLFENDFSFERYYSWLRHRQRTLGLGLTTLYAYAGASEGGLPPQKYFTDDFVNGFFLGNLGLFTLNTSNFSGNRNLTIAAYHDFRKVLWEKSGIPGIKDIPLWLNIHGGVFWTEFRNHVAQPGDELLNTANKPYRELGFGLGNLTPFMSPLNLAVYFTWQLSHYDTESWVLGVGVEL